MSEKLLPFPPLPEGEGVVMLLNGSIVEQENFDKQIKSLNDRPAVFGTISPPKLNEDGLPEFDYFTIPPEKVAFSIKDIKRVVEGGVTTLVGTVKVLKTPDGVILSEMLEKGISLNIRPRTYFQIDSIPGYSGQKIITWDVVPGEKE